MTQLKFTTRFARSGVLACTSIVCLTAFGPNVEEMNAQVAGLPGVGIVVATLDGGNAEVRSYGVHFDGNSKFEIGSITKTFTASLFADMIRRGEVAPGDPIERYLPPDVTAPVYEGRHITLADLATQSSGLPRMPTNIDSESKADPAADYDATKMFAFLSTYKLRRAPGARYEYSNYGFGLLGELLARRLKMSYTDAVRERILAPLHMIHTVVETVGTSVQTVAGHNVDGDPVPNTSFEALAGAGAIVSTPNDMLLYARANLPGAAGPLAQAMRDARSPKAKASSDRRIGYAWQTQLDGVVWHNGETSGFRSFLGFDEARNRAIFIVANATLEALDQIGFHALNPAAPLPPTPLPDAFVDRKTLGTYVGSYRFSDKSIMTVMLDARGLIAVFDPPGLRARLHPRGSADFTIREPAINLHFDGADLNINVTVDQDGQPPDLGTRVDEINKHHPKGSY